MANIGGVSVASLVQEFGSPLYAYDLESIRSQFQKMKSAFEGFNHSLHFAVKSMNNISVLKFIKNLGACADTVSVEEIEICLCAGFETKQIIFTPSGPSTADIDYALGKGIMITIDNLVGLEYIGQKYGGDAAVSIRLNPEVLSGGDDKICVAGKQSKFGLAMSSIDAAKAIATKYGTKVVGLHIHTGSDISSSSDYFEAVDNLIKVASTFETLDFLDLGSGFKVTYNPEDPKDKETNLVDYGTRIKDIHDQMKSHFKNEKFEIKFEPGKFIICKSGNLIVTANVVKETNGVQFVIVDSGLNHLIRPMMYAKAFHKITNASKIEGPESEYNICGYICETDTFGSKRTLHAVSPGDHLIIHNAGAYGMTMASNYNCKPRPAEVAISGGKANLVRKRETFEEIIKTQVIIDL
jgi:diaminopimelate decarboxylase